MPSKIREMGSQIALPFANNSCSSFLNKTPNVFICLSPLDTHLRENAVFVQIKQGLLADQQAVEAAAAAEMYLLHLQWLYKENETAPVHLADC